MKAIAIAVNILWKVIDCLGYLLGRITHLNHDRLHWLSTPGQKLAWELGDYRIQCVHHICQTHLGYLRAKLVGV